MKFKHLAEMFEKAERLPIEVTVYKKDGEWRDHENKCDFTLTDCGCIPSWLLRTDAFDLSMYHDAYRVLCNIEEDDDNKYVDLFKDAHL